jgi:hypothetical protein
MLYLFGHSNLYCFLGPIPDYFRHCAKLEDFNVAGTQLTPPVCLSKYADTLRGTDLAELAMGWVRKLCHTVEDDPHSLAPKISGVATQLSALHTLKGRIGETENQLGILEAEKSELDKNDAFGEKLGSRYFRLEQAHPQGYKPSETSAPKIN